MSFSSVIQGIGLAAVDAGANAAARVGELISSHLLARPHDDLLKAFVDSPKSRK